MVSKFLRQHHGRARTVGLGDNEKFVVVARAINSQNPAAFQREWKMELVAVRSESNLLPAHVAQNGVKQIAVGQGAFRAGR